VPLDLRSLSYADTVSFDADVARGKLLEHLAYCFREADASSVETQQGCITFKASPFRLNVRPWRAILLGPFDFGNLSADFDARKIRYCLSFRQVAIASTVMTALLLLAPLLSAFLLRSGAIASLLNWHSLFAILAVSASWGVLMVAFNLLWGIPTFARFLQRAMVTAPRYARPTSSLPPKRA
jgi:hypothetical protein